MASYWKSPYKRDTHADAFYQTLGNQCSEESLIPFSARSYCGLSKVKQVGPVSPQDWFDWALAMSSNFRPAASNFRPAKAEIKGILKNAADESVNDDERTGHDTESNKSAISETALSKKEKKRVTFGDSSASEASYGMRFHPSNFHLPSYSKLKQIHAMSGLPKQLPQKRQSHVHELKKLPGVGETSNASPQTEKAVPATNSTCKHSPDLRCAHCVSSSEAEKLDTTSPTSELPSTDRENNTTLQVSEAGHSVTSTPGSAARGVDLSQRNTLPGQREEGISETEKRVNSSQEPLKKYQPHWTKTFVRSPNRKKNLRLASRRYNVLPNSFSKKHDTLKLETTNVKVRNHVSEDFSRLHICGNGKMVQTKLQMEDVVSVGKHKALAHRKIPQDTASSKRVDHTTAHFPQSFRQSVSTARGKSAPSRLVEATDTRHSGNDVYMDKTSQILSWLNDVRSKSQFKPKNARTYVSDPSDLQ